jgi:PAS domain-containing protein
MNDVKHLKHLDLSARIAKLGFWVRDIEAQTVAFSDELCVMLGLPLETVIDLTTNQPVLLLGAEVAAELTRLGEESMINGTALDIVIDYRGGRRLHLVNWIERVNDKPVRVYGVAQDITDNGS